MKKNNKQTIFLINYSAVIIIITYYNLNKNTFNNFSIQLKVLQIQALKIIIKAI